MSTLADGVSGSGEKIYSSAFNILYKIVLAQRNSKQSQKNKLELEKIRANKRELPLEANFSKKQMKQFSKEAKRYNVSFSALKEKGKDGKYTIIIDDRDMPKIKHILNKMVEQSITDQYDKATEAAEKKGDMEAAEKIDSQRKQHKRKSTNKWNDAIQDSTEKSIFYIDDVRNNNWNGTLNRNTDHIFAKEEPYYAVDAENPSNYIEFNTKEDVYKDKPYTRTDYKVFKNNQEQKNGKDPNGIFSDRRFEGRKSNYWQTLKNDMKKAGGFSDVMISFSSKEEVLRFQEIMKEKNADIDLVNSEQKFSSVEQKLTKEISESGYADISYDKLKKLNPSERIKAAEIVIKQNQLSNQREIRKINTNILIKESEIVETKDPNKKKELEEQLAKEKDSLEAAKRQEALLEQQRRQAASIEATNQIREEYERTTDEKEKNNQEDEQQHEEQKEENETEETYSKEEWQQEIDQEKAKELPDTEKVRSKETERE